MLAISEKDAKSIGGKDGYTKIAVSEEDKKFAVFLITHNCYNTKPCLAPKRIDSLLTDSDWLDVACKKYRLPGKEIRKLKKVWSLGAPTFESDNVKAQLCFRELEKTLIGRMKRLYMPEKRMKMLPWIDLQESNSKPANMMIIANTAAGKSTLLTKMLCTVDKSGNNWAHGRKIVAFTMHRSDPSMKAARKCHSKNWIDIDLDRVNGPIDISAIPKGALVLFDDVLELPRSDPRREFVYDLLNRIVTSGRMKQVKRKTHFAGLNAAYSHIMVAVANFESYGRLVVFGSYFLALQDTRQFIL